MQRINLLELRDVQNVDVKFSELCRKTLEKHYGGSIPMPEEVGRRANLKRKIEKKGKSPVRITVSNCIIGVRMAVSNFLIVSFAPMRDWIAEKNTLSKRGIFGFP